MPNTHLRFKDTNGLKGKKRKICIYLIKTVTEEELKYVFIPTKYTLNKNFSRDNIGNHKWIKKLIKNI